MCQMEDVSDCIENGLKRGNIHCRDTTCKDMDIIWLLRNSKSSVCFSFYPIPAWQRHINKVDCPRISKQSSALH